MRKFYLFATMLALCACLMAGCRDRNTNTTLPSTDSTVPSSTAPHIAPNPSTTPSTGVLPDIGDDLMPDMPDTTAPNGDMARTRPGPRY